MATLLCECGHRLWSEFWWNGTKHLWVFFDDERTSETYLERITSCPDCGRQVTRDRRGASGDNFRASQNR
jgi:hypothetical protein